MLFKKTHVKNFRVKEIKVHIMHCRSAKKGMRMWSKTKVLHFLCSSENRMLNAHTKYANKYVFIFFNCKEYFCFKSICANTQNDK